MWTWVETRLEWVWKQPLYKWMIFLQYIIIILPLFVDCVYVFLVGLSRGFIHIKTNIYRWRLWGGQWACRNVWEILCVWRDYDLMILSWFLLSIIYTSFCLLETLPFDVFGITSLFFSSFDIFIFGFTEHMKKIELFWLFLMFFHWLNTIINKKAVIQLLIRVHHIFSRNLFIVFPMMLTLQPAWQEDKVSKRGNCYEQVDLFPIFCWFFPTIQV